MACSSGFFNDFVGAFGIKNDTTGGHRPPLQGCKIDIFGLLTANICGGTD
jgi:hypothetical protein